MGIQPAGGDDVCPVGFTYTKATATSPVVKSFHDTNGGKCFIHKLRVLDDYSELGPGHCVDATNQRPPHCHAMNFKAEARCAAACNGNKGCTAYEWRQSSQILALIASSWFDSAKDFGDCYLIQPAGGDVCPVGFKYIKTTATNPVVRSFHDGEGGKCFIHKLRTMSTPTRHSELGPGHCVDVSNQRPPHCYTTNIESEADCRSVCNGNKGCTAYEWGQMSENNGPYCQLIQPAGGNDVCPPRFKYTKTTATNMVVKSFYDTNGGKCVIMLHK